MILGLPVLPQTFWLGVFQKWNQGGQSWKQLQPEFSLSQGQKQREWWGLSTGTLGYSQPCSSLVRGIILLSLSVIIIFISQLFWICSCVGGRVLEPLITCCLKPEAGTAVIFFRCTLPLPNSHAQQYCRVLHYTGFSHWYGVDINHISR